MSEPTAGTPDPEQLAANNLWRCRTVSHQLTRRRPRDFDESLSVALVGLADAVRTYEPRYDAGGGFGPYVNRLIRNAVINYLKGQDCTGYRRRQPSGRMEGDAVILDDGSSRECLAGEPPVGWAMEWEDFVHALCLRLPGRKADVIRVKYLHADAQDPEGLSTRLGVNEARARLLHREAIGLLREQFGVDDASKAAGEIVHAILNDLSRRVSA